VLGASLVVGWLSVTDWIGDGRMEQPFGYPNAQAGFFVLSATAALMLAVLSRRPLPRAIAFGLASGFAGVVLVSGSLTAIALLLLPAGALLVRTERSVRRFVSGGAALVVIALVGAVVLGALTTPTASRDGSDGLGSVLSERRLALWSDALALMQDSPLKGVGPGRFGLVSPIARSDPDARWAHNEFLQVGAETGVVGMLLLVAVFLWGFWALAARSGGGTTVALGAAALATVGIHASADYVLRFPALPLVTAALLGAAIAPAKPIGDRRRLPSA
jgi:O-antigen ligase